MRRVSPTVRVLRRACDLSPRPLALSQEQLTNFSETQVHRELQEARSLSLNDASFCVLAVTSRLVARARALTSALRITASRLSDRSIDGAKSLLGKDEMTICDKKNCGN